jgi:fumarate reductase subunit D
MLRCDSNGQMTLFPDVTCWQGTHIIHACFAIIVSIIFILIAIVVSLTYFESRSTSNDLAAKVTSRADVFIVVMKTILLYVFSFLVKK